MLDGAMPVNADSTAMTRAYDDFSQAFSDLDRVLDDLDASLETSLAEWDGQARQAFDVAHREWRQTAKDMAGQLAALRQAIMVAHRNYSSCEAANLRMFSQGRP